MENRIIGQALDIGERMLQSGGEVSRVEDTIGRILHAYGFEQVDVFTITSQIQVTAVDTKGHVYNQFRRVNNWGTQLEQLERLNQLSRDICVHRPSVDEIQSLLSKSECPKNYRRIYIGSVIAASAFTIFFGGSFADACVTFVLAFLITCSNLRFYAKKENQLLVYFFISLVTGCLGTICVHGLTLLGFEMHLDKILIGCVMLTIPGIAITYSVRDMFLGETITGMLRFIESLLIAASIAAGFVLASILLGGGA